MPQVKVNQDMFVRVVRLLLDGPLEVNELVAETGMHRSTANSLLKLMWKHKVVHICGWEKDSRGRDTTPVYKLGEGRDRSRSKMSAVERQQRYRQRKKQMITSLITPGVSDEHQGLQ